MTKKESKRLIQLNRDDLIEILLYLGFDGFIPKNIGKNIDEKFEDLQDQTKMLDQEQHEINKEIISLQKYRNLQEERWEMLKDYLKVEEKEYAELEQEYINHPFTDKKIVVSNEPVKKTKLIKKK